MLETVKTYIDNLPEIPFPVYFNQYVLAVQDVDILNEIDQTIKSNNLDLIRLSKHISNLQKELENDKFS